MKKYDNFRRLLQGEGVRSCLPQLCDDDVDAGVQLYHNFKANGESYAELQMKYKVLALRLGDVDTTPHGPVTRTNITNLGKVVIPPSTTSQFLAITLHDERPTQVIPPIPQPTTVTWYVSQPTLPTPPAVQPNPTPSSQPHIPQPTLETLPVPREPPTIDNVETLQSIQVSPVKTTPTASEEMIWKAASLMQANGYTYRNVCFKLGINLDPTKKKFLGKHGDDYKRLKVVVRKLRRRAVKERMIQERNEVGAHTQI